MNRIIGQTRQSSTETNLILCITFSSGNLSVWMSGAEKRRWSDTDRKRYATSEDCRFGAAGRHITQNTGQNLIARSTVQNTHTEVTVWISSATRDLLLIQ